MVRVVEGPDQRAVRVGVRDRHERQRVDLRLVVVVPAVDDPVAHEREPVAGLREEPVDEVAPVRLGQLVPRLAGGRTDWPIGGVGQGALL